MERRRPASPLSQRARLALLVACCALCGPLIGQEGVPANQPPEGQPIVEVRVVGNETVSTADILRQLRTRAGRSLQTEVIEDDVRRLNRMRRFINVQTLFQRAQGGVVVIFQVFERPTIREVKYLGNYKYKTRALEKETGLTVGSPIDPYLVEEGRRKIEDYYKTRGYTQCRVRVLEGHRPGDHTVAYLIHEGDKQIIRSVQFVGNTIVSDGRLKTQIQSKPLFFFFQNQIDPQKINDDVDRLTAYYRSLGYFRARVGRELLFDAEGIRANLTFVIDEGPRYAIRNVSFHGNRLYDSEGLSGQLTLKSGQYFDQTKLNKDLAMLRDLYGGQGYVFADVKADPRFLEEPGQLDLIYNIDEGDRYRVGRIFVHIAGEHPHTRTTTVLNRISLQPGDICDIRQLRASERRLRASGLFINNPAQGSVPKITFVLPDEQSDTHYAKRRVPSTVRRPQDDNAQPPPTSGFRGQSPDDAPPVYTLCRGSLPEDPQHRGTVVDVHVQVAFDDRQPPPAAAPPAQHAPPAAALPAMLLPRPAQWMEPVWHQPAAGATSAGRGE